MRLVKRYDPVKLTYTMSFELSATELFASGDPNIWQSNDIDDFIALLQRFAHPDWMHRKKKKAFEDILRDAQRSANYAHQQQQQYTGNFGQQPFGNPYRGEQTTAPKVKPAWAITLGLEADATPAQIKARYRQLAKENHPDRGGDATKFAKISAAYEQAPK